MLSQARYLDKDNKEATELLDKVAAYQQLHPGLTHDEAQRAVEESARINRSLGA